MTLSRLYPIPGNRNQASKADEALSSSQVPSPCHEGLILLDSSSRAENITHPSHIWSLRQNLKVYPALQYYRVGSYCCALVVLSSHVQHSLVRSQQDQKAAQCQVLRLRKLDTGLHTLRHYNLPSAGNQVPQAANKTTLQGLWPYVPNEQTD